MVALILLSLCFAQTAPPQATITPTRTMAKAELLGTTVATQPAFSSALVSLPGQGTPLSMQLGSTVKGWTLVAITPGTVQFKNAAGELVTLSVRPKAKPASVPPSSEAQAPERDAPKTEKPPPPKLRLRRPKSSHAG